MSKIPCVTCGKYINFDDSFCQQCGTPNQQQTSPTSQLPPRPNRPVPTPKSTPSQPQQFNILLPPEPTKKEKRKGIKPKPQYETILIEDNKKTDLVIEGLKKYYRDFIKPLEVIYKFESFHSPSLNDVDFDAVPMVLLIGQYSTGKTSFIQYLVEKDFLGMRIGPEPTTDRFTAVMYSQDERIIPGNALAAMADKPFNATQKFGMNFLNRFEATMCNSPILKSLTIVDTPGVLSGEKQRIDRSYNFSEVIEWFAQRADRIILLFDAHKLDISDELKSAIEALAGQDDKIRCILNKADTISSQQLMRVYGALMWSLGRVFKTPEVIRVYTGSFWSQPLQRLDNEALLLQEEADLLADLKSLPRNSALRRINEMVKRARQLRVHILIIEHLRTQFGWFGKEKTQDKLLNGLLDQFKEVQKIHNLPIGDFPHLGRFREVLKSFSIHKFPELDKKALSKIEWVLAEGIPELMRQLPSERNFESYKDDMNFPNQHQQQPTQSPNYRNNNTSLSSPSNNDINPFSNSEESSLNPFADSNDVIPVHWDIAEIDRNRFSSQFFGLKLISGKLSGGNAKQLFLQSGLSGADLKKIWELSDIDKDGYLDLEEYIIAMYFIEKKQHDLKLVLPNELEFRLVPPSKRELFLASKPPSYSESIQNAMYGNH